MGQGRRVVWGHGLAPPFNREFPTTGLMTIPYYMDLATLLMDGMGTHMRNSSRSCYTCFQGSQNPLGAQYMTVQLEML